MSDPEKRKREEQERMQWLQLAGIGFEFAAAVLLFGLLGWWLDGRLGTLPWLMLAGFGVGFATGLWLMVRTARQWFRD